MVLLSLLRSLCRNIFRRRRVERDLDDEVRACFASLEEEKIQRHAAARGAASGDSGARARRFREGRGAPPPASRWPFAPAGC